MLWSMVQFVTTWFAKSMPDPLSLNDAFTFVGFSRHEESVESLKFRTMIELMPIFHEIVTLVASEKPLPRADVNVAKHGSTLEPDSVRHLLESSSTNWAP